jgi:hypothetical protein
MQCYYSELVRYIYLYVDSVLLALACLERWLHMDLAFRCEAVKFYYHGVPNVLMARCSISSALCSPCLVEVAHVIINKNIRPIFFPSSLSKHTAFPLICIPVQVSERLRQYPMRDDRQRYQRHFAEQEYHFYNANAYPNRL